MQFGATYWVSFKENYCRYLTFVLYRGKNKGFVLELWGQKHTLAPPQSLTPASYAYGHASGRLEKVYCPLSL